LCHYWRKVDLVHNPGGRVPSGVVGQPFSTTEKIPGWSLEVSRRSFFSLYPYIQVVFTFPSNRAVVEVVVVVNFGGQTLKSTERY
jgi:hypothetical protein